MAEPAETKCDKTTDSCDNCDALDDNDDTVNVSKYNNSAIHRRTKITIERCRQKRIGVTAVRTTIIMTIKTKQKRQAQ